MTAHFDADTEQLKSQIAGLELGSLTPVHKGYSGDLKFIVDLPGGDRRLLRLFPKENAEAKQKEFAILRIMIDGGVKCSEPLATGEVPAFGFGYMLLSYVEGDDAAERLPLFSTKEQYQIGEEAGQQLRLINRLAAPDTYPDWYGTKLAKHRRYTEQYRSCGVRIRKDDEILAYIERHADLMKNRPNRFQHDDFHPENLIVHNGRLSGVIDFGRCDWGDPVHEFLKTGMFSSEISVPFSIGQIRGYHGGLEPDESFWRLYALYLAMTVISSVVWTLKVQPEGLPQMMDKIERVLDDHDCFAEAMPKWYRSATKEIE